MSTVTLNPQVLGRAENAHRALLEHLLTGTELTYVSWVGLTLAVNGGEAAPSTVAARIGGALKIDADSARAVLADLSTGGLLDQGEVVRPTESGRARYGEIRAAIDAGVRRAYADIEAADLAVAGRVLAQVTAQIDAALATA